MDLTPAGWKDRPNAKVTVCRCGGPKHWLHDKSKTPVRWQAARYVLLCMPHTHAVSTVPAGSYWNGTDILACPNDTFTPDARPVLEAAACRPCPTGLITNDTTGNVACGMCACGSCVLSSCSVVLLGVALGTISPAYFCTGFFLRPQNPYKVRVPFGRRELYKNLGARA
jgi:hypothetical protein